jgi:hypothetical protein
MMTTPRLLVTSLALLINASVGSTATSPVDPDKDPAMASLLQEARRLIDHKNPAAAIERCDKVISAFKARYGNSKQKITCGRTSAEVLGSLLQAAAEKNWAKAKQEFAEAEDNAKLAPEESKAAELGRA